MLLFADGFEAFNIQDMWRKWSTLWLPSLATTKIVHGLDTTFNPPKQHATTETGRSLYITYGGFGTVVKPSRTLFVGYAWRAAARETYSYSGGGGEQYRFSMRFYKGVPYNKLIPGHTNQTPQVGTLVATCEITVYPSYIRVNWIFVGGTNISGNIQTSAVLNSGDWRYFQVGLTLAGNVAAQPQSWAEVRFGGRGGTNNLRFNNIMTAAESGGSASYLMNYVQFRPDCINGRHGFDDIYICNDEGEFNNTFLGPTKVRRVSVSGDGTDNSGVPHGVIHRFQAVDEDFIDTVNPLPNPLPDPETDPLFIPWETFAHDHLTLEHHGNRQLFRFRSLNLTGTYSKIHGTVLTALLNPVSLDVPSTITAVRKFGVEDPIPSIPMDAPMITKGDFEARQFVWENQERVVPGASYLKWEAPHIDSSEWGLELKPVPIPPNSYDPAVARINIVFYETMLEAIDFYDFSHRYFEEFIYGSIGIADVPQYEYVWKLEDTLMPAEFIDLNRGCNRFLNEVIEFAEYVPYTILFANSPIYFTDAVFIQFIDAIDELIDLSDWNDGFWEELTLDGLTIEDLADAAFVLSLEDTFGLEEPYVWDNHELVEDGFSIDADEPWDNHEICEEYLHPDDATQNGVGLDVDDSLGIVETHFDGNWVEQKDENIGFAEILLTQHWRYEKMFGMVMNSWQVDPIEQYGNDGNHTGDNPWGA